MNAQKYLDDAFRVINENFRSNDATGGMTAASAAYLVKRVVGDHRDYGFPKFKDVLRALASEGRLRTGSNSKDAFSLWLVEGATPTPISNEAANRFRPLRNHVWFAFVADQPEGKRYLHRVSGEVRVGCSESPGESWVEVRPIPPEDDRNNARRFLDSNEIKDATIRDAIDGERWYVEFPQRLSAESPLLAVNWKRQRSSFVIDYVRKWCAENDVDQNVVFESFTPRLPAYTPRCARSAIVADSTKGSLREVLLKAIDRMSTDDLLRISIPPSHLIAVLRPDLLR